MADFSDSVDEAVALAETITEIGGAFLVSITESVTLADTVSETIGEICHVSESMTLADTTDGNWTRFHARFVSPAPTRRFARNQRASRL